MTYSDTKISPVGLLNVAIHALSVLLPIALTSFNMPFLRQSKYYREIINILCAQAVEIYDVYLLISLPTRHSADDDYYIANRAA